MRLVLGKLTILWADPCEREECTYYRYYLRPGPPGLTHAAYHLVEKQCLKAQQAVEAYEQKGKVPPHGLVVYMEELEKEGRF